MSSNFTIEKGVAIRHLQSQTSFDAEIAMNQIVQWFPMWLVYSLSKSPNTTIDHASVVYLQMILLKELRFAEVVVGQLEV